MENVNANVVGFVLKLFKDAGWVKAPHVNKTKNTAVAFSIFQKQRSRGILSKRCSENMQQIYRRTPMPKCDFNKVALQFIEIALWHGCSPAYFAAYFQNNFS